MNTPAPASSGKLPVIAVLIAAVAAGVGLYAGQRFFAPADLPQMQNSLLYPQFKQIPDFRLTAEDGRAFTQADLKGRWSLVFIGFTHCPDICPTAMSDIAGWMKELGAKADELQVLFVTVDPERDRPAELAAYAAMFDPRIRPLVGTEAELAAMAKAWRVYYRRVPLSGGGYTMDHTATMYLVGRDGRFAGTIDPREPGDTAIAKLRRVLAGG
jgi:protein SCO1/2